MRPEPTLGERDQALLMRLEALEARVAQLEADAEEQELARSREHRRYCQERRHGGSQA